MKRLSFLLSMLLVPVVALANHNMSFGDFALIMLLAGSPFIVGGIIVVLVVMLVYKNFIKKK